MKKKWKFNNKSLWEIYKTQDVDIPFNEFKKLANNFANQFLAKIEISKQESEDGKIT